MSQQILIAHIVFSFDVGGLENGVVNLINHSNDQQFKHVIICLSHYTDFFKKIKKKEVNIYALNKKPGKDYPLFFRLYKLLKQINPDIVHTRNMATLECQLPAMLAGIRARIHGEHGWDMIDLAGGNKKYQLLRKLFVPMVKQYIALSKEGFHYLHKTIGINEKKLNHIYNGVDTDKFSLNQQVDTALLPKAFYTQERIVFGTVGRMAEVKNQIFLVRAFLKLLELNPTNNSHLRLLIVGDGILMKPAVKLVDDFCRKHNTDNHWIYFTGQSDQVHDLMRLMDVFVLPSLAEGISNTILEAMATSLPVIATDVGGNSELVVPDTTGHLVEVNNTEQLAETMLTYIDKPSLIQQHGEAARKRIIENFSLNKMIRQYEQLYQKVVN